MALPRFHKLPRERQEQLLAAAAIEFAANGYPGTLLGAIADKSGIGKSSFYYYFTDKSDLFGTVLEEAWQRLSGEARLDLGALTRETFWPELERVARQNLELCTNEPWLLAASKLLNQPSPDPTDEKVLDVYREKRRAWEAAWIHRGQELGAVRDDLPAELLVTISMSLWQGTNLWMLDRAEASNETPQLALKVLRMHQALLSPPAAAFDREDD